MQWTLPFGAVSAANWLAMIAQRRMYEFGLTREQLAQIALNGRRNAALQPQGDLPRPMSLDDYLAARMISTPLCLFDCDAPVRRVDRGGGLARDYAPDTPSTGVPRQRHRHRPAGPAQLGPVRRHDHVLGPRRGAPACGSAPS